MEKTMETTRLSSKGQIIIPKTIRESWNWKPGMEFSVEESGEGIVLRPLRAFPRTTVNDLLGCTGYKGPKKSLKEMDLAIAKGVKTRR
jgi:AbrB family looped-hinge helix DNA binding protein